MVVDSEAFIVAVNNTGHFVTCLPRHGRCSEFSLHQLSTPQRAVYRKGSQADVLVSTKKRRAIQIIDVSPRKKSRNRTNSELTKTTSNLSQHIFVEARRKAESDADDPAEEAEMPIATDDSFPSDDEPETPPEVGRNHSIATRAEWFTKPLHRLPPPPPADDELRAPTSTPDLSYALGSEAHAPSSRFDVAPPATVRSLARPDRRVLWESVDGAVSNHAKRTRQTLASKEIRIVGGGSRDLTDVD